MSNNRFPDMALLALAGTVIVDINNASAKVDVHACRCKSEKGDEAPECRYHQKAYRSICPSEWVSAGLYCAI